MQFSASFVRSVYAAVILASTASAVPFAGSAMHATMRVRAVSADKTVDSFHPESSFEVRTGCVISEHAMTEAYLASDLWCGRV